MVVKQKAAIKRPFGICLTRFDLGIVVASKGFEPIFQAVETCVLPLDELAVLAFKGKPGSNLCVCILLWLSHLQAGNRWWREQELNLQCHHLSYRLLY